MPSETPPQPERVEIESQLAERLGAGVELVGFVARPASRLYRYRTHGAEPVHLVVKIPLLRDATVADDRPRRLPPTPADRKASLEFAALRAAQRHFATLGDARFASVEAIALLEPMHALVMRHVEGQSLRAIVKRAALQPRAAPDVDRAFERAGAWLRAYHAMVPLPGIEERLSTPDDVATLATRLGEHLRDARRGSETVDLAERTAIVARRLSAADLPLAVVHGDFAMRNVMVNAGQVAVLDMLGRWRAPAYEDVSTMMLALDGIAFGPRLGGVLPLPPAIRSARAAFLRGYFGDDAAVPRSALATIDGLLTLDRLAALHARRSASAFTVRGLLRAARRQLEDVE
jgi:aminoglycoside phosphotransferase (APT) family kinase protein